MWRCGKCALCCRIIFCPERAAKIPVGKEEFFGLKVLCLEVENTGMGDKAGKAVVVMSGKPVYGKSTIGGANGTDVVAINI